MECKSQDKGHIDQYLEEWLSKRGSQHNRGCFSEDNKQESTCIEGSTPEGDAISYQYSEREISQKNHGNFKMVIFNIRTKS